MVRFLPAALAASVVVSTTAWSAPTMVGNYYEDNQSISCPESRVCRLTFAATPAGKFLTIERVNCHTAYAQPVLQSVALTISTTPTGSMTRFKWLPVTTLVTDSVVDYVADLETRQLVGPVRYPNIFIQSRTAYWPYLTCSIVGTLQNQ